MLSVVVAVYNKLDYLRLVLAGFEAQSERDFELIIADDGSGPEFVDAVRDLIPRLPFPARHVWHEDIGFRKNAILNRAVVESRSDYLLFVDGDCVPHPEFVREHWTHRAARTCLTGRRVNLSERVTRSLTPEGVRNGQLSRSIGPLLIDALRGGTQDVEKGIYLRDGWLRRRINRKARGLLGCNFSLHKVDLLAINGFDERYEAPSIGEDTDVQYRLELNGVRVASLNNAAIQYHLHHRLLPRPDQNLALFEETRQARRAYAARGIRKDTPR